MDPTHGLAWYRQKRGPVQADNSATAPRLRPHHRSAALRQLIAGVPPFEVAAPAFTAFVRQWAAPTRIVTSGALLTGSDDALRSSIGAAFQQIFQVTEPYNFK